jgi:transaldolase
MATRLQQLTELGQSPWYDNIRRNLISAGSLQHLMDGGIRGVTVNPSIFEKAIAQSTDYDAAIRELLTGGASATDIYEHLLIEDVRAAADLFRPLYDRTEGRDGYVSLEVSPRLAYDTTASIAEARRFWNSVSRPNLMIKIPGTVEGIPAIKQLIGEGININITLIFSLASYERVMAAYLAGLEQLAGAGRPLQRIASVASFFVSRVDTEVDKRLDMLIASESKEARRRELAALRGTAAVANARIACQQFLPKIPVVEAVMQPPWVAG